MLNLELHTGIAASIAVNTPFAFNDLFLPKVSQLPMQLKAKGRRRSGTRQRNDSILVISTVVASTTGPVMLGISIPALLSHSPRE